LKSDIAVNNRAVSSDHDWFTERQTAECSERGQSGGGNRELMLTTVVWSSAFDSRLVEAGGTLVNLAAAVVFWLVLRSAKNTVMPMQYFLLITCACNLFSGTGYFFFSGVTNFGDWAAVISGLHPHWLWRTLLVVGGAAAYYAAVRVVGIGLVRYVGVPRDQQRRMRKLTPSCRTYQPLFC
jgi:hypothetical protein